MGKAAELKVQNIDGGAVFKVKVVPGSSRTEICGVLDGMIKIKVTSPPEKGKANQTLLDFLAQLLDVKKKQISIIAGQTSKVKQIRISSMSAETFLKKLELNK